MLVANVAPDFRTVCTGKYSNGVIAPVKEIPSKTNAVLDFPPRSAEKRFRSWFVPQGMPQEEAASVIEEFNKNSNSSPTAVTLRTFPEVGDLARQLDALMACSGVCPNPASDFGVLQDFYQWLMNLDRDEAGRYYSEVLYKQILDRGFIGGGPPADARPTHFVTVVSSPALIGLAHRLFQFEHVMILHTAPVQEVPGRSSRIDFSKQAQQARNLFPEGTQRNVQIKPFKYQPELAGKQLWDSLKEGFAQHLGSFIENVDAGRVMWDMTSGLRIFSHVLEKSFARPGDWMLAINQQWSPQHENRIPCTETLVAWRHSQKEHET
jgi:hypothetical protein